MLLARRLTSQSLDQIGHHFGKRDHTTVMHACRRTEALLREDPAIQHAVENITVQLSNRN
jgi:chromosomal replication initiator protein